MNLKIHNLGRIKDEELELRPLTVFSGHNGTNKTWVAWAVWELLRRQSTGVKSISPLSTIDKNSPLTELLYGLLRPFREALAGPSTVVTLSLDSVIEKFQSDNAVFSLAASGLEELLGTEAGVGENGNVELTMRFDALAATRTSMDLTFEPELGRLSASMTWRLPDGSQREYRASIARNRWSDESLSAVAMGLLLQPLLTVLCFPADRAGILLAAEGGTEIRGVPPPVEAFADAMRLMRTARVESKLGAEILPLLSRIAGGEIRYAGAKGDERLVLDVSGRALPIGVASSLSRSVAGLSQYLRAFASPGDVILIDELEMNAHPAAQLALVELMAVMVSHGIRIVLTTHSPYVIDHLNNLLEAGRAPEERQAKLAKEFQLKTPRAFLTREQVSVYAFEATEDGSEVKVNDAIDPETGLVSKSTFAPVTERLSQIFNAALDASEE